MNSNEDVFDRQKGIEGWKQEEISRKTALILGVGGLGCGISQTLARLGIGKLILIDKDRVDATNLNRQLLFSKKHVGRPKVEAAREGLEPHIVGETEVEIHHIDVLSHWPLVVQKAKESDVIFNNIDIGGYFDFAVISLARSFLPDRTIPVAAGSSYARTWVVEYYDGFAEHSSFSYANPGPDTALLAKLSPDRIALYSDLLFCSADANPDTRSIGSSALVCTSAAVMTVNAWVQSLFGHVMPNYTKFDIVSFAEPGDTLTWSHDLFSS